MINKLKPKKALNKAFLKVKPNRIEIEKFKTNLIQFLDRTNDTESEEFHKNLVIDFLKNTYYSPNHYINTKGRNDLVIHNDNKPNSSVGVLIETKKPTNRAEMVQPYVAGDTPEQMLSKLNKKALHELVLYYLRERITHKNLEVKHLVITNINEWFVFDANTFDRLFAQNKSLVNKFKEFEGGRLAGVKTDFFYNEIAAPFIATIKTEITYTYFNLQDYDKPLRNEDKKDDNKLIELFKLLSPEHLLKLPFANDSNSLNKSFYSELLHILGLVESKKGSKKLIGRNKKEQRNTGSILEDAIIQLDSLDKISRIENSSQYGATHKDRLYNVALELSITWMNRILFLKLLEAQLFTYHQDDDAYAFLNFNKIKNYDDLNTLFFQVLARKFNERNPDVKKLFDKVPYLNSSLFEPTELEHNGLFISNLRDDKEIPIHSSTVLKNEQGKRRTGKMGTLEYLFAFLNAYDFSSEGSEKIQEENKTLINASVLGLIFEKINGYKDGSFFTPGFITMYMCKETIRKSVLQKFNDAKGWSFTNFTDLYNNIDNTVEGKKEANNIINSIKVCDPAVGSGHFLVSALNEIIAIKHDLNVLIDSEGRTLRDYEFKVENDELIVTYKDGGLFEYNPNNKESQRVQETIFHEKQTIIENCLFGVDINPNSVKICRLRLWIELLKHAYYKNETELETLPNIDINIKCGNSLVSRFDLDSDLKQALRKSKWSIDSYRVAVATYRNAENKEQKREMERLIDDIKSDFRSEISSNDPKVRRLYRLSGELANLTQQQSLFEMTKREKAAWNKKVKKLTEQTKKLEAEIEEIKANKIYENAFEWRFEFPEVLNDDGDFVGFDVVIGNPPYIQLSKVKSITNDYKRYLLETYKTSGGRLNTFIFFIHLSNEILYTNGFSHYIIPNTILSQEYYSFTRNFLVNEVSLTEIVNFPTLPFEDAVVETVLIQYQKKPNLVNDIEVKELTNDYIKSISLLKKKTINKDSKHSFIYHLNPIIEMIYEKEHKTFGEICHINQGIALKGDRTLSLTDTKINDQCYKVLDGRNINKFSIAWDNTWLDYDLDRIHSCKRKDIFESKEKLMFRRVSSSLIFTYDDDQFFALNTLVIVNKKNIDSGPNLKYILGLMNSKLMNYVYTNRFKSTKTVFSEVQAGSVKKLPISRFLVNQEKEIEVLANKIIQIKNENPSADTTALEAEIDHLVYKLYDLTQEEIKIIENA